MMEFTLNEALGYAAAGKGKGWVCALLRHTGNDSFAKRVEGGGFLKGPIALPLRQMARLCGPEEGMPFPEKEEEFERRVTAMVKSINEGWDVPPLTSWYLEEGHSLADGGHRHEALLRAGYATYWTFIFCSTQEDLKRFNRERSSVI